MTIRKDFMLCPTGRGLAATRRPFGDAHLPVWHSIRTRISSHYQTTQHKNEVSTLSGDLTWDAQSQVFGAGIVVVFKVDNALFRNADGIEIAVSGGNVVSVRASWHHKTSDLDLRFRGKEMFEILFYGAVRNAGIFHMPRIVIGLVVGKPHVRDR